MIRLAAPVLAEWRASGWESEVQRVSPEEYKAFMERLFPTPYVPKTEPPRIWLDSRPEPQVPLPLVAGRDGDSRAMSRVVGWLRAATPGSPDTESDDFFRGLPISAINISWGNVGIIVRAAWVCGPTASCTRSSEEVLVDDGRPFHGTYHVRSPELAGWLASGYLADMRMGTYEEYEQEAHW